MSNCLRQRQLLDSPDEEDQFEQASLKDQERSVIESTEKSGSMRSSGSDAVSQFSGNDEASGSPSTGLAELNSPMTNAQAGSDAVSQFSGNDEASGSPSTGLAELNSPMTNARDDHGSSPGSAKHPAEMLKSVSSVSVDSASSQAGDSGSPLYSPPKVRARPALPDVSPELVHLVETAIQGEGDSLEKLRETVSGEESVMREEEVVGISRLVVDVLLATMGGVEGFDDSGDGNPPSIMLNARAAVVAGQLIPWLPCEGDSASYMSPRTRIVKGLFLILKACTRNRTMCSNESLLGVLLSAAEMAFMQGSNKMEKEVTWDANWLCRCLQLLAQHSITVSELHRWLEVVTNTVTIGWASHLMLALEKAIGGREASGPACTFEFDGESSGLLGPGESRWPFSNGYAFITWLYIESFADTVNTATAAAGKSSAMLAAAGASALAGEGTAHMPRLYSFLSADNQGIEAYFHGPFLVVESGDGKGKKASLHFTHAFKPQCWYFVGLEHTYKQSLLGKAESELRLYVDGTLYESRPFEFPRISKPLAFCCIGTNPPPTMAGLQRRRRQCPLFAEMGPVYIFKEHIGPEGMARIASRGGDVLPSFGHGAGAPWLATNEYSRTLAEESYLLDAEIGGKLHLLYHPRLLSGRFCPDASPSGATGIHRRPAEILGQVYVASRVRPSESLWAMAEGGPMCLLPLAVSKAQPDTLKPEHGSLDLSVATATLSAPILRIISLAIQHHGNNQELCHAHGPEILAILLRYLLETLSFLDVGQQSGVKDEELVAAVVSLCQSQKNNLALKVELFYNLLLDLRMWSLCSYGIQKKLLSSLADMVFSESSAMREANAVQMLLDGCRRCYWTIHEPDSIDTFSLQGAPRPMGEVNALVDELLVVIELLVGASSASKAVDDVRCLIGFLVDCPHANQVARVLQLFYRLIVQPNANRAHLFAESFISCGGIETLLFLLQREAKTGDHVKSSKSGCNGSESKIDKEPVLEDSGSQDELRDASAHVAEEAESVIHDGLDVKSFSIERCFPKISMDSRIERMASVSESLLMRNLGGISFSITADSARNNVYNVDNDDGIVVGVISLLGALLTSGQIKFASSSTSSTIPNSTLGNELPCEGTNMFADKVSLLLFALQKAFQAAPQRLMTANIYITLLGVTINASSSDDGLNLYDSGHRFEHVQLLLVLLRSLPFSSRALQARAIQDLMFLACSHPENRICLTGMEEWPEWILEVLISNYEAGSSKDSDGVGLSDIEDLVHNFLIIILEHSMRQKDGWKDIEATLHCAEWLSMIGGSSTGDQRIRREESLPIFKRKLLGGLLDFAARELQVQTQVIAAAAAGVASEGLSPQVAKAEAESAAQVSVALAENSIVILMFVEDHFRLQSQLFNSSRSVDGLSSPASVGLSSGSQSNSLGKSAVESPETGSSRRQSLSSDTSGLSLDVLASMADANGQLSMAVMERLTAAAAAEPYESVRCAFVSYGSCALDLADGWKYRSRLWYGVGFSSINSTFGGGGSGWDSWTSALEKDSNGSWIELPLVKKSITMLQALLLDESGLGIGGGSGIGMGGMAPLYQLLDSNQPFLCMLRLVLVSMREEDNGEEGILARSTINKDEISESSLWQGGHSAPSENISCLASPKSALLWSVLSPVLNMPISESKRQRVLVASCILYSEVYHAVGRDKRPLRKQYLELILPPFVAILRRWRPLLAGIHELTSSDGMNPLVVDDRALAADALPVEASLAMISPGWAAAFASPPAAMALAMIAAGAAGTETAPPVRSTHLRRDSSLLERKSDKTVWLHTFASFQKPLEGAAKSPAIPKDQAAAKAAALAAARDLERNAKIGSGRGLSAVAMATSAQRRSIGDMDRVRRWNISDAMGTAWTECLQAADTKGMSGKDHSALSYKYVAVLVAAFALARNMQRVEVDRRSQVDSIDQHHAFVGTRAWRRLIHCLIEINALFGPLRANLCSNDKVFWKLDFMESSSRMRRCLRRNYYGCNHVGAAANFEHISMIPGEEQPIDNKNDTEASLSGVLPSSASILVPEALLLEGDNEDDDQDEAADIEDKKSRGEEAKCHQEQLTVVTEPSIQNPLDHGVAEVPEAHQRRSTSSTPGHVLSESDERIVVEFSSSMVRPLRVIRGTFQVTTKRINFIVDKLVDEVSLNNGVNAKAENNSQEKDWSWSMPSLHQVFSRRYLLRRSALELFMLDQSNFFFDFGTAEGRRNAYKAVVQARPPHLNNIYLATQRPEQLFKRTQLMERWSRWEISNFEYLMQLNTLAGRSYNDITQYPVFPWILADYSSKDLDLDDPSSYRDLSKPVGALNADRLEKFLERYSSFDDPIIPKFHYGSHYSSAGTVLYYLVRIEPFTTLSIQLQGGKFDHADRMFSDIAATWNDVKEDMSDVKELVPELFYLPEALTNENQVDFGTTQLGGKLDTVKLPPWAKTPVDFIHKHLKALESEHVSNHLHEWIDLIFGYKQRGKEAIAANNVFFYITYEGAVDIDKIIDPVLRQATQDQIAYFGQTPSQLLSIPHLKKRPLAEALHLQTIFRNPTELRQYVIPNPERCNVPAAAISASPDSILITDSNAPAVHVALHKWQPNTPDGHGMPFLFQHEKGIASSGGGAFMRMFKGQPGSGSNDWQFPRALAFPISGIRSAAVVAITSDNYVVTGGHADNTVKLISYDGAKTIESAAGHCAPVTCLAVSPNGNNLVTGSRDTTLILWWLHKATLSRSSNISEPSTTPTTPTSPLSGASMAIESSRKRFIEGPIHVFRGHISEVICCCVNSDIGIAVSCSQSTGVLLHSIRRGRLLRKLDVSVAHVVCLSSQGVIITWNKSDRKLHTFTVNGIPIATAVLSPFLGDINCMEVSVDGESSLIGVSSCAVDLESENDASDDMKLEAHKNESSLYLQVDDEQTHRFRVPVPSICFMDLHSLEVFHTMELKEGQDITAMALNKDNTNLVVSTADKQLMVFTDPSLSLKVVDQMLRLGWEGDGLSPLIK